MYKILFALSMFAAGFCLSLGIVEFADGHLAVGTIDFSLVGINLLFAYLDSLKLQEV